MSSHTQGRFTFLNLSAPMLASGGLAAGSAAFAASGNSESPVRMVR
jgi:hypothetical protein